MMTTVRRLPWCLVLLLACSDPSGPPTVPQVAISPAVQWSGGEVLLTSHDLGSRSLPRLLAGAETLAVRRVSDSVVAAVLPLGPSGTIAIDLVRNGSRYRVGQVERAGFRESHLAIPGFVGELVTAWRGSTPVVLGEGSTLDFGIQELDLNTMLVAPLPGVKVPPRYGLSPTRTPNEFLALDSLRSSVQRWRYGPVPAFFDTVPTFINSQFIRQSVQFQDSVWLITSAHSANVRRGSSWIFPDFVPQGGGIGLRAEGSWNVFLSPRGDVATYSVNFAAPGVPVFRMSTGDTAYTLGAGFPFAQAAGFSGDGDRIFFLGGARNPTADSLLVVRAATGEVLGGVHLPADQGLGLAIDPVRPLAYVEVIRGGHPSVLVYDQDLDLVGELPAPVTGTPTCDPQWCWKSLLVVDRARSRLHSVWYRDTDGNFISTYDLLPTP